MLLTQIKKDRMVANKEGNKKRYETLTTLLSEIQRLDKPDQEDDSKVQGVCKKYIKGLEDMIKYAQGLGPIGAADLFEEKEIVKQYLPKQLTENQLKESIQTGIIKENAKSLKDMGKVMKYLKEQFDGQYDGKLASQLVKDCLK